MPKRQTFARRTAFFLSSTYGAYGSTYRMHTLYPIIPLIEMHHRTPLPVPFFRFSLFCP